MKIYGWYSFLARSLAAAGLMVAGCSGSRDELPREPVAGTVTLDGRPLAGGVIQFAPAAEADSAQPPTSATYPIEEGRFAIPRADGLVPGRYKVSISELDRKLEGRLSATFKKHPAPRPKELIPAKYNTRTTLTAEIPKGGTAELKFDLQSK